MARWLVIGGTRFVGHHIAQAAQEAGHSLTLLHRGQTPCDLQEVEELLADRDGGLDVLGQRTWDAVVDVCGYLPRVVEASARALAGRVGHYTFISTLSVFPAVDPARPIEESDPLLPWEGPETEEITDTTYGPLKVRCEAAVLSHHPGATLVRPGYVVGPRDPSRRFSFWVRRVAAGGRMLFPANTQAPVQVIDARDLARFVVLATEGRLGGAFNAVDLPSTWARVLDLAQEVSGAEVQRVEVDPDWLVSQLDDQETSLPMWLPPDRLDETLLASAARAREHGLRCRPLAQTTADILADTHPEREDLDRLDPSQEAALLEAWASASPHTA